MMDTIDFRGTVCLNKKGLLDRHPHSASFFLQFFVLAQALVPGDCFLASLAWELPCKPFIPHIPCLCWAKHRITEL